MLTVVVHAPESALTAIVVLVVLIVLVRYVRLISVRHQHVLTVC